MSLKSKLLALKKLYRSSKLGARGGGNLDKIQKNSSFFLGKPSLTVHVFRLILNEVDLDVFLDITLKLNNEAFAISNVIYSSWV